MESDHETTPIRASVSPNNDTFQPSTDPNQQQSPNHESHQTDSYAFHAPIGPPKLKFVNRHFVSSTENLSVKTKSDSIYSYDTKCPGFMIFHKLKFLFRNLILIALIGAVFTSIILLFLGVLLNFRACLTAGCILGIACIGVLLHGCLRHRSLPNSPMPVVLSAACIYPMASVPISSDCQGVSAAAVATAALIPSSIQEQTSLLNSSFGSRFLSRFPKAMIIYSEPCTPDDHFPDFPTRSSENNDLGNVTHNNNNRDNPQSDLKQCVTFQRQISDSVMYTKPKSRVHRPPRNRSGKLRFSTHMDSDLDERLERHYSSKRSNVQNSVIHEQSEITGSNNEQSNPFGTEADETNNMASELHRDPGTNSVSHQPSTASTPDPQYSTWVKPDCDQQQQQQQQQYASTFPSLHPTTSNPNQKSGTLSSVMRYSVLIPPRNQSGSSFSRDCLNLLTEYQSDHNHVMSNRSFNRIPRDREDIFGPRVWQGWKNWVDP